MSAAQIETRPNRAVTNVSPAVQEDILRWQKEDGKSRQAVVRELLMDGYRLRKAREADPALPSPQEASHEAPGHICQVCS